jgi:Flp pilus assembly protein TadG
MRPGRGWMTYGPFEMGHPYTRPNRPTRDTTLAAPRKRGRRGRGQSMAEFAIILPMLLAFVGLSIDFARVFQAWITIESATRDGAETAATNGTSNGDALTMARKTICLQSQTVPGFQRSSSPSPADVEACVWPNVSVVFTTNPNGVGSSVGHPVGTATVQSTLQFRPLFNYPLITQNGVWTISAQTTFSIAQGRT